MNCCALHLIRGRSPRFTGPALVKISRFLKKDGNRYINGGTGDGAGYGHGDGGGSGDGYGCDCGSGGSIYGANIGPGLVLSDRDEESK